MEFKKDVQSAVPNSGCTLELPKESLKMLILGPNLITPMSLEVGPLHGLNLKAFQVIVICIYGGKPLPKARKYQFYMSINAFLSANIFGPYM